MTFFLVVVIVLVVVVLIIVVVAVAVVIVGDADKVAGDDDGGGECGLAAMFSAWGWALELVQELSEENTLVFSEGMAHNDSLLLADSAALSSCAREMRSTFV